MNVLLFVLTVLIWGTTWIAISMQVGPVPVLVSVFYRFALSALIMIAILLALGKLSWPRRRDQPYLLAQALCLFCCNFICFYYAAAYVPSGLISVIFSLATIFNALNARIFFGERIAARAVVAAFLGAAGVFLLFADDILVRFDASTLKGLGLSIMGTVFFSLGNMLSRRNSAAGVSVTTANAWGTLYGSLILLALTFAAGAPLTMPPDAKYLAALVYLAVVGTVIGFTTYLLLVARIGSSRAAYATVCFPVVALAISTVYEGYEWHMPGLLGVALTIIGNIVMFSRKTPARVVSAGAT